MPTYEYGCEACGHEWEEVQRITEPPREVCPACGKPSAHRLISAGTGFILKGGGWYSDLYTSPKPSASNPEKAEKSEGKTESKAETASSKTDKGAGKAASTESSTGKPSSTSTPSTT